MGRTLPSRAWLSLAMALFMIPTVVVDLTRANTPPQSPGGEKFTAIATNLYGRPLSTRVEIDVKRWTPVAERDHLLDVLKHEGEQALYGALQDQPVVGTIQTPDSLAYPLRFAEKAPWGDGGQRVIIATARPISFWEASQQTRSMRYPFTIIEMRVNGNGRGQGKMSVATRVIAAGRLLVLENYDSQPTLLNDVQVEE
jgi:hypothetical protein